jgi:hypothetical protein
MGLSRGQQEAQRIAERVDQSVDFGAQSAFTAADRLIVIFFWAAPELSWWARTMVLSIIAYSLSASVARRSKRRFLGPTAEPLVGVLPIAKPLRQVAPRNSGAVAVEHRFDESAVVVGGDAHITGLAGQQVLDSLSLVIAKCISVRGSALFQADSPWVTQTVVKADSFYYTIPCVYSFYVQPSK